MLFGRRIIPVDPASIHIEEDPECGVLKHLNPPNLAVIQKEPIPYQEKHGNDTEFDLGRKFELPSALLSSQRTIGDCGVLNHEFEQEEVDTEPMIAWQAVPAHKDPDAHENQYQAVFQAVEQHPPSVDDDEVEIEYDEDEFIPLPEKQQEQRNRKKRPRDEKSRDCSSKIPKRGRPPVGEHSDHNVAAIQSSLPLCVRHPNFDSYAILTSVKAKNKGLVFQAEVNLQPYEGHHIGRILSGDESDRTTAADLEVYCRWGNRLGWHTVGSILPARVRSGQLKIEELPEARLPKLVSPQVSERIRELNPGIIEEVTLEEHNSILSGSIISKCLPAFCTDGSKLGALVSVTVFEHFYRKSRLYLSFGVDIDGHIFEGSGSIMDGFNPRRSAHMWESLSVYGSLRAAQPRWVPLSELVSLEVAKGISVLQTNFVPHAPKNFDDGILRQYISRYPTLPRPVLRLNSPLKIKFSATPNTAGTGGKFDTPPLDAVGSPPASPSQLEESAAEGLRSSELSSSVTEEQSKKFFAKTWIPFDGDLVNHVMSQCSGGLSREVAQWIAQQQVDARKDIFRFLYSRLRTIPASSPRAHDQDQLEKLKDCLTMASTLVNSDEALETQLKTTVLGLWKEGKFSSSVSLMEIWKQVLEFRNECASYCPSCNGWFSSPNAHCFLCNVKAYPMIPVGNEILPEIIGIVRSVPSMWSDDEGSDPVLALTLAMLLAEEV